MANLDLYATMFRNEQEWLAVLHQVFDDSSLIDVDGDGDYEWVGGGDIPTEIELGGVYSYTKLND